MPRMKMKNRRSRALTPRMRNAAGHMQPDRSREPKRKQSHLSSVVGLLISVDKKNSDQQMGDIQRKIGLNIYCTEVETE